jgi:hypothetical protein
MIMRVRTAEAARMRRCQRAERKLSQGFFCHSAFSIARMDEGLLRIAPRG